jgi:hypothetical protein
MINLTSNNVMFGINRKIGGWWTFELLELPFYLSFIEIIFLFLTFGFMKNFIFGLWGFIFKLISILSLHLWISIYVFVSLFFTIYKYESTHFLMLFKTRTTNLQKENPYFKRIENNLTFSDHTMEWNCERSHFHSLVSMIILFWNFMFGFVIILIVF